MRIVIGLNKYFELILKIASMNTLQDSYKKQNPQKSRSIVNYQPAKILLTQYKTKF
jgi:hypothetical protein